MRRRAAPPSAADRHDVATMPRRRLRRLAAQPPAFRRARDIERAGSSSVHVTRRNLRPPIALLSGLLIAVASGWSGCKLRPAWKSDAAASRADAGAGGNAPRYDLAPVTVARVK